MGPDASLTPELIQAQSFTAAFRGFDQGEVRSFLNRVATEMRAWRERAEQLESAWHSAEERAARPPVLDEDTLMAAVGEETASILRTARAAATEMRSRATEDSERMVAEARAEAEQLLGSARSEAERLMEEARSEAEKHRSEADAETEKLLSEARAESERLLGEARSEAEHLTTSAGEAAARTAAGAEDAAARLMSGARSEAAEILEKARTESETMRAAAEKDRQLTIEGAHSTRDRILEDLSRRRRIATVQIEQLRAGRERLIESYAVVRRTLEEVSGELSRADAEARAAADEVGRRMAEEPEAGAGEPAVPEVETPEVLAGGPAGGTDDAAGEGPGDEAGDGAAAGAGDVAERPGEPAHDTADSTDGAAAAGADEPEPPAAADAGATRAQQDTSAQQDTPAQEDTTAQEDRPATGRGPASGKPTPAGGPPAPAAAAEGKPAAGDQAEGQPAAAATATRARPKRTRSRNRATDQEAKSDPDPEAPGSAVDELFARIRGTNAAAAPASTARADQPAPDNGTAPAPDNGTARAEQRRPGDDDESEEGEARLSDADEALLQWRESAVVDLEVTLTRRLKRALQDEQNDVLDRLRNLKGEPTVAALLPDGADQTARYRDAAQPLLQEAARAGAGFAAATLDLGEAAAEAAGRVDIEDLAGETGSGIVDPLRRRLEQAVERNADDDPAVLIESLGAAYREWKTQRIERLAGDMLSAAFSRGTWEAAPDGAVLRWIVEDTDGPCPDCDDDALAGELPKGEVFPTGQHHPPAHSGCRCLLVPGPPAG
ncbi:MAG TPA: DivIVA domain-containing protein [Acidimicrobiales bacterium]|nr:DivIVA domain-containing protein [Acidimicrobiales bacterium]